MQLSPHYFFKDRLASSYQSIIRDKVVSQFSLSRIPITLQNSQSFLGTISHFQ